MAVVRSYKDLIVWQKSIDLVANIYSITEKLPSHERFGLSSQLQRAAVSIAASIAEGHGRGTRADYAHFLDMANGSVAEVETLITICKKLSLISADQCSTIEQQLSEIGRMLGALRTKLKSRP